MIRFTQAQKDEFDKLYAKKDSMTLLDVLQEIQRDEYNYPVLYLYLFGGENGRINQDNFAEVWLDSSLISVQIPKYYLVLFPQMYIALDPDGQAAFTDKWDFAIAYQKQFTQLDIEQLQQREEFKNRINLNTCKIEVEKDDEANPRPEPPAEDATDEDFDEDKSEPVPPDELEEPDEESTE